MFNGGRNVVGDETIHTPFSTINNVPPNVKKEGKLYLDKSDLYDSMREDITQIVEIPVDGESNKRFLLILQTIKSISLLMIPSLGLRTLVMIGC